MEIAGLNNILAVILGITIVIVCCLISFFFQKKLFAKYRDQVRNTMDKANSEPSVLPDKKV